MVMDASAAVELLLNTPAGNRISSRIEDETEIIHAPHLIDIEVAQVLRRHVLHGLVESARARRALDRWRDLDVERYAHEPLLERVWQLRHNVSAYDAVYVALAEALSVSLVTADEKLVRAPGLHARIELA